MSVPNQYKGFSRLPEHVQRRMDPQLAQKYQMGGAVMQRPLFRQAGGPAQPMPQDMPPAMPPQAPMPPQNGDMGASLQNVEQAAAAQMQQAGEEYASLMMQGLDNAEDYKGVIDSLRGNDKPIEARYQELANLVGPEDAQATPESVLTLVQPTIMMTEQGAMDSGIGELMQAVAGQVDMETADGAPTQMAGGVGSLMAAGAGNTPPRNFSQGGPVRLQAGGNPQLEKYYQDMLPLYESILGGTEEQKNMSQAQALFAIADAAGRFASGQGAGGQDLRGLSPAAQLGGAITGLGGQLGALGAQTAEQDRAMKLAALQAAQGEYSADRAAARAASTAGIGDIYEFVDADGNVVGTEALSTKSDLDAARLKYPDATVRKQVKATAPNMVTMVNPANPSQFITVNENDPTAYANAVGGGFLELTDVKSIQELQNPDADMVNLYNNDQVVTFNLADPAQKTRFNALLQKPGWSNDPNAYTTQLQSKKEMDVFNQQEKIREQNRIAGELRAQGYQQAARDAEFVEYLRKRELELETTLNAEARAQEYETFKFGRDQEATIAAELRAQGYQQAARDAEFVEYLRKRELELETTLSAEARAQEYETFKFDRDQEATIAQELRQQGYIQAAEDRNFVTYLKKRELELGDTLSAEERAQEYETFKFNRNQEATIAAELRQQGYIQASEDRDFLTYLKKRELELGDTLSAEERAQEYETFKFNRNQEATIAAELRQQGYIQASEDRDFLTYLKKRELELGDALSAEERAREYETFKFNRNQEATIAQEIRQQGYAQQAEDRAWVTYLNKRELQNEDKLSEEARERAYQDYVFERDQSTKSVKGIPRDIFNGLTKEEQSRIVLGDPKDPQTVKGIPRDIFDKLSPDLQRSIVAGDEAPKTLIERQQQVLLDQNTVSQFASGTLSPEKTNELVTVLQAYTAPAQGPQGTTTSKPIPINLQRALKQRQELGLDTFGFDPALFGQAITANDFDQLTQNIIDPNVDLEKGAGLLSGLASALNYVFEQTIGETGVGSGTAFGGTKRAKQALQALSSSTRKFALEGRQLAQELNLQLTELPDGAFTTSDAKTLSNIKTQQQQLDMFVQRVTEALKTPQSFTSSDLSKVRQQLNFAVQLKKAYDAAYNNLAPGAGGQTPKDKPKASDFRRD